MERKQTAPTLRVLHGLILACLLLGGLVVAAGPVRAHDGDDDDDDWPARAHRRHAYAQRHDDDAFDRHHGDRRHDRRAFVVPRTIHSRHAHHYRPYRWGRAYHRAHQHHHVVYRFPVYTAYGVHYDFVPYCAGVRFVDRPDGYVEYRGPRFQLGVRF
jgi:hypothetical protein